jgi:hypothetical protein
MDSCSTFLFIFEVVFRFCRCSVYNSCFRVFICLLIHLSIHLSPTPLLSSSPRYFITDSYLNFERGFIMFWQEGVCMCVFESATEHRVFLYYCAFTFSISIEETNRIPDLKF